MFGAGFAARRRRWRLIRVGLVASVGLGGAGAGSANAAFVELPAPPQGTYGDGVGGLVGSGDRLAAVSRGSDQAAVMLSPDSGGSWQNVAPPADCTAGNTGSVASTRGGGFVVALYCAPPPSAPVGTPPTMGVWGLPAGSATLEPVGVGLSTGALMSSTPVASDDHGGAWLLTGGGLSAPPTVLRHVDSGGQVVSSQDVGPGGNVASGLTNRDGTVWITVNDDTFSVPAAGGTAAPADENANLVFSRGPLRVRASDRFVSLNGGRTYRRPYALSPIPGSDVILANGQILKPYNDALYVTSGLAVPDGFDAGTFAESGHLYLLRRDSSIIVHLYRQDGPLPDSASHGDVPSDAAAMVDQANRFRAEAGFPLLVADPLISQAARNHSHYWTLNDSPKEILDLHNEKAGKPGFTGESMSSRCGFVGTACNSEIMYPDTPPRDAVSGWMATIYHRTLIGAPTARVVGGGRDGKGPSVMDGSDVEDGLQLLPLGYPNGTYSGQLSFSGEAPSPFTACKEIGQPVSAMGVAVTFYPPEGAGSTSSITLTGPKGRVAGCTLLGYGNAFIPDGELLPRTLYAATATYDDGSGQLVDYRWSFTTGNGDPTGDASATARRPTAKKVCKATFSIRSYQPRSTRNIRVRANPCDGVKTISLSIHRVGTRKVIARTKVATKRVGKGWQVTYLRPRRTLPLGRYVIKARAGADRYTKTIRVIR